MGKNTLARRRFSRERDEGGGGNGQTGSKDGGASNGTDKEGAGSEGGKEGDKGGKEYVPPASQEELDRIIEARLTRERGKYADYDTHKANSEKWTALERESQTDQERREREIREEAEQNALAKAMPAAVRAEFKAAAKGILTPEQVASLLEDLNLANFVTDKGEVDEEKVAKKVEAIAPAKGGNGRNGSGPGFGQGNGHSQSTRRPGEGGLAEAERRYGKPKQAATS